MNVPDTILTKSSVFVFKQGMYSSMMELKSVLSQLYLMFKILESVSVLMLAPWLVLIKAT